MTEQHRGDCLRIDGHPVLLTPNMDSLAAGGVRFTRAYTTCPTCIAARRSLLSGQFPSTHGMVGYRDGIEWNAPLTLPGVLSKAGYHTHLAGRAMHQSPTWKRYGFDSMVTNVDYLEWLKEQVPDAGGFFGSGITHNDRTAHPWPHAEHLHNTNWTVDRALEFLKRRDPSCPFFLITSFMSAHPPLQPPQFYFNRYLRTGVPDPHIGDWAEPPPNNGIGQNAGSQTVCLEGEELLSARAGYYGLINHVDDQIRRLLNPAISGIDPNNTIILLTADHGEMLGDHYRWHKVMPYEGAARIPLLVRVPDRFDIEPGTVLDAPVCLEDIMPTLLEMAGIETPDTVEGSSLLPLMCGNGTPNRPHLHIEHSPAYHCLTDGREKYVWFVNDGREQFFDLTQDPNELHDLINAPERREQIEHWRNQLILELRNRPEGFSDGKQLVAGRPYPPVMPHALPKTSTKEGK